MADPKGLCHRPLGSANLMPKKFLTTKALKLFIIGAICLIFVFWGSQKIFSPVRGVFLRVAHPFEKAFYLVSQKTQKTFSVLTSISELREENEKLLKENYSLSARVADLESQKSENEVLRKQLELAPRDKYQLESAFVIGRDPRGSESWLIIDKGKRDGVEAGMPIVVSEGILVGKIEEVFKKSSKVTLLSSSSSFVNAIDLATGAKGVLSGEYGLGLTLEMVSQTEVLNEGDEVVSSGLGGSFPKSLLIGKVGRVENTKDRLFQRATINSKVKYDDLSVVFVIKNSF